MSWWELLLTVMGLVAAAFVTLLNVAALRNINIAPRRRATLRTDLEILKLLKPTDENYQLVKASVNSSIRSIYQTRSRRTFREQFRVYDWPMLIIGLVFMGGFGWWTGHLGIGGSWWAILPGYFALAGLFYVFLAFRPVSRQFFGRLRGAFAGKRNETVGKAHEEEEP